MPSYCGMWLDDPATDLELFMMTKEERIAYDEAKRRKEEAQASDSLNDSLNLA